MNTSIHTNNINATKIILNIKRKMLCYYVMLIQKDIYTIIEIGAKIQLHMQYLEHAFVKMLLTVATSN